MPLPLTAKVGIMVTKDAIVCNDKRCGVMCFRVAKKLTRGNYFSVGDSVHFIARAGHVVWVTKRLDKLEHIGGAHLVWSRKLKKH